MKKNDLEKQEPLLVNTEPEATNSMTSRALFFQRKLYDKVAFSSPKISPRKPLDFWYEKPFYGRSDVDSRAIHLSERNLKQFPIGTAEPLYGVNFVVDAFMDMRQEISSLRSRGAIKPEGAFAEFELKKAWVSPHQLYHFLMDAVLYQRFKVYINRFDLERDIVDFKTFINVFTQFVDTETPRISFTRSKSILTNKLTPMISGLAIEIDEKSHAEDTPKMEDFIRDPNFPIFKETAMRFGFLLDKHAPWRLIADLGSPAMAPYMENYGVSKEDIIDRYYYKSHLLDLETLKTYIIEFYNSYVTSKPTVVEPKFAVTKCGIKVMTKKINRTPQEKELLDQFIDDQFWLRMYTFIRAREENKAWNQAFFEKVVRNAVYYSLGKNMETAIEYIDRKCKIPSASPLKERDFSFINTTNLV